MPDANPLSRIKHVIVLMLENRSFDNLLGWLYTDKNPPPRGQAFEGLRPDMWNPLDNIDADGIPFVEKVYVRKNGEPPAFGSAAKRKYPKCDFTKPAPDPGEGFKTTNHQLFGQYDVALLYPPEPTNMGFVNDYRDANLFNTYTFGEAPADPRDIMITYTPEQTPVLSELARQYAVCDHWYGSVPSQTLPNRHFVHAATSTGQVNNKPDSDCDAKTIYNAIQDAIDGGRKDLSWRIYCGTGKGGMFCLTRLVMTQIQDKKFDGNFQPIEQFYKDCADGNLPSYTFLEPQFHYPGYNDQHPPQDIRPGDKLMADIYNAVSSGPQWNETLLVLTYDEHGGCYDHAPPPGGAKHPDKDKQPGQDGFLFNRFGVRVPTVVISPLIEAGTVLRPEGYTPFDHTTVISTARKCFGLDEPLTQRDAHAPDLGCALTLDTPRTDKVVVKPLPLPDEDKSPKVNDLHHLVADILAEKTGKQKPSDEEIHNFVHEAYHLLFENR